MRSLKILGREAGVSMVEMAFALPIFVVVTFGLFEVYNIYSREFYVAGAVRNAAILAAKADLPSVSCQDVLRAALQQELSVWGLDDALSRIDARHIDDPTTSSKNNAFEFSAIVEVPCYSCGISALVGLSSNGTRIRIRRKGIVELDQPVRCNPESWTEVFS